MQETGKLETGSKLPLLPSYRTSNSVTPSRIFGTVGTFELQYKKQETGKQETGYPFY